MGERLAGVLFILIIAAGIGIACRSYLFRQRAVYSLESVSGGNPTSSDDSEKITWQLISDAQSKEDAEEIAAMYGVTFLEYLDGAALYETEEDPLEVIRRGEEQGYPQMWVNSERIAY